MIEGLAVLNAGEEVSFVVGRSAAIGGPVVGEISRLNKDTFVVYDDKGNQMYEVINCSCIVSYKKEKNKMKKK